MPVAKGLWPHAYSQPIPGNFSVLAGLREARDLSDTLIVLSAAFHIQGGSLAVFELLLL